MLGETKRSDTDIHSLGSGLDDARRSVHVGKSMKSRIVEFVQGVLSQVKGYALLRQQNLKSRS